MEKFISMFALNEARRCGKGYTMSRLHLNYNGGAVSARSVVKKALEVVKEGFIAEQDRKDVLVKVWYELSSYPVREDDLIAASEQEKTKVYRRIEAMTEYLWIQPGARKKDIYFSFEIDGVVFRDKADIVLEIEGLPARAIIFEFGESSYTSRARKPENHPSRCVGINMLAAAGYAEGEVWYLKSKDENKDSVPPFEVKKEKNIVKASVVETDAKAYLLSVLNNTECGDCKGCRHQSACVIREVRNDKEEVASGANRDPQFTEEQEKAVNHREGPMAFIAVPGAGKTTVLVHRIVAMLSEGIPASKILAITFTKKAAGEIKERIEALLPEGAEIPAIFTFNALGYTLLKENPTLVGKRVKIADENDRKALVRQVLDEAAAEGKVLNGMSYAGAYLEFGIIRRLADWFKEISEIGVEAFVENRGERIPDIDGVLSMYERFDVLFKKSGFISFDEQITLINEVFRKYPRVSKQVADRFQYIMVDEYQDTSRPQADMIYEIAKHHENIVVVGDEDQTIYSWRGGSSEYLLKFKDTFPNAEIIIMSDNFRSNVKILEAANSVIGVNQNRFEKNIRGHKEANFPPLFFQKASDEALSNVVAMLLRQYKPGDIAILARTNKKFDEVEKILDGVVKMSTPKDYLVNDAVFEMIYDVLTLYNSLDDVALYRCLSRLGVTEFPEKPNSQIALYDAIREVEPHFSLERLDIKAMEGYEDANKPIMKAGKVLLSALKKLQYYRSMEDVFNAVADAFQVPRTHRVFENLLDTCDEHAFVRISDLYEYMRNMVLFKSTKRVGYSAAEDAVTLLTGHDSKGQEFPVVIIYGAEDFAGGTEEDNCLLYVAMTRAKNTLIMIEGEYAEKSALTIGCLADYVSVR